LPNNNKVGDKMTHLNTQEKTKLESNSTSMLTDEAKQKLAEYFNELNVFYISTLDRWVSMDYLDESKPRDRFWETTNTKAMIIDCKEELNISRITQDELIDFAIENDFHKKRITSEPVDSNLRRTLNKAAIEYQYWVHNHVDYFDIEAKKNEHIDLLFTSLSGNKQDNINHLYDWLAYKIFNTSENTTLPAINIFGAQGTGKNLFFENLLPTIFHGNRSIVNSLMKSVGGFNSEFEGATVLVFNESAHNKADSEGLKNLIGSKYQTIEKKGMDKYTVKNMLSYLLFTNDVLGSIQLEAGANRRYSIIHADTKIQEIISLEKGIIDPEKINEYLDILVATLSNEKAVMQHVKWMKNEYYTGKVPKAHQTNDYDNLKTNTRNTTEQVLDYIFKSTATNCVPKADLIRLCLAMTKESTGKTANERTIKIQIDNWASQNDYCCKQVKLDMTNHRCIISNVQSMKPKKYLKHCLFNSEGTGISQLLIDNIRNAN